MISTKENESNFRKIPMGYDLKPLNSKCEWFHFDAFSFPILLEACGYLFPCIHNGRQWYCAFGVDPRMPQSDNYPRILSNDGFVVTKEEAHIMARIARNFVVIQHSLPELEPSELIGAGFTQKSTFERRDIEDLLMRAISGGRQEKWPMKIRDDFTDKFEKFADWVELSEGFEIY